MVKGLEKTFLQRRYTNGQQAYEKMLNNINQINANKTTMNYHLTPISTAILKSNRKQQVPVRMWSGTLANC